MFYFGFVWTKKREENITRLKNVRIVCIHPKEALSVPSVLSDPYISQASGVLVHSETNSNENCDKEYS